MNYTTVRTNRKTIAIQIKNGEIVVRAPLLISDSTIDKFVRDHSAWIEKHLPTQDENVLPLTDQELDSLYTQALEYIPRRVEYYASMLGVGYGRITVRCQRTRWGSCSARGNLNFNCLLMLAPAEVIDSVVVHEVCHLKEMNHSSHFYAHVLSLYPDYHKHHKWLKLNGQGLMSRVKQ